MSTVDKVIEKAESFNLTDAASKALEVTKNLIDAATPVAKQAYEIGLMTLQVDALASLVPALLVFIASVVLFVYLIKAVLADYYLPFEGGPHFFGICVSVISAGITLVWLFDIWLWVKLFKPELWLVHQAIEKLVK